MDPHPVAEFARRRMAQPLLLSYGWTWPGLDSLGMTALALAEMIIPGATGMTVPAPALLEPMG
jgi:hypothetical protein